MYARGKIGIDPSWRGKLVDFFQYLTQAATKVDRCAVVASLLATDPSKSDTLGKELTNELYAIFRRQKEEGVQPVQKEDVAEVLRRRFFTPDSIRDREAFRSHVVAALKGISTLDEQTSKEGKNAEERFLKSYPFHPDLTEIFYTKWTNLESFQRTRGILRTFALALRDAEKWDESPLVSTNAFLSLADADSISESARELTGVATSEEYEGKKQEWSAILQGELNKAKQIQQMYLGLRHREVEQAVLATFLHSQPIGQKAVLREIYSLVGHTRPDKIELEKALRRWTEVSWFLDEGAIADAELAGDGKKGLPKTWRLGSRPNLRQMHSAACDNVIPEVIEAKLLDEIQKVKSLTAGAAAVVGKVHNLPEKPKDIEDDGDFHYGVLGPKGASDSGKPSAEARRFIDEKTGADSLRVYRNAVVLASAVGILSRKPDAARGYNDVFPACDHGRTSDYETEGIWNRCGVSRPRMDRHCGIRTAPIRSSESRRLPCGRISRGLHSRLSAKTICESRRHLGHDGRPAGQALRHAARLAPRAGPWPRSRLGAHVHPAGSEDGRIPRRQDRCLDDHHHLRCGSHHP